MMLEAVWLKNGKEIFSVYPVMNIVCDDDMDGIEYIEIDNGHYWYTYQDFEGEADDFMIRIKKE